MDPGFTLENDLVVRQRRRPEFIEAKLKIQPLRDDISGPPILVSGSRNPVDKGVKLWAPEPAVDVKRRVAQQSAGGFQQRLTEPFQIGLLLGVGRVVQPVPEGGGTEDQFFKCEMRGELSHHFTPSDAP